jgi:16S rRNA processing protein RimM
MKKLFAIAKILHTSGLSGEVQLRPLSRYFEDYVTEKSIFLGESEQMCREVKLLNHRNVGKKIRYQFEGIETKSEAEALIGQYIFASVSIEDDIYLIARDLIGYSVVTDWGEPVGELTDILWLPAQDIYVIKNMDQEFLIPVIPEIVKRINHEMGIVEISPVDGLLS